MIYDINSTLLTAAADVEGTDLQTAYDVEGQIVFQKHLDPVADRHDVLYTQGHTYVFYDGSRLYRSTDGGKTIDASIAVGAIGKIKNIHVFTDGTLNVFGHTKAYYSDDWVTLNEATVLDASGNPYVFDTYDVFTVSRHNGERVIVNGVEMYVFGNYCITDEYNQKKNVWYTTDKGHTYKSAYEFGKTMVRHVHNVYFNPVDSSFWITTGDTDAQSYVIKGFYNTQADAWSWTTLGNGYYYKWAGMEIYNNEVYWALDQHPGEVRKCAYADVGDTTKHTVILGNLPNDCINVVIDSDTGEMVVGLSIYGGSADTCRRLYYSADRVNFAYVTGEVPSYYPYSDTMYYGMYGINADKKILSGLWSRATESLADWDKVPSVWIDDIIRSRFPNAFPFPIDD